MEDMGIRIAKLRKENHISQEQLAEMLNISVKHCSEVERGVSCLSLDKLVDLCSILSSDLDYIVRGINKVDTNIPSYIYDLLNSEDRDLFLEYVLMFKKIKRV